MIPYRRGPNVESKKKAEDASRLALAGGEFERATHVESIEKFKEAQTKVLEGEGLRKKDGK